MSEDWKEYELGDICNFQGGSQPPKSEFIQELKEGYVRLLQIRDFKSDDKAVYIPITKKNKVCKSDDIMIGRYGASVGQIHRGKSGAYNVALIRTIPNEEIIDKNFFYHYLVSDLFQKPLMSVAERSAQAGFSKPDIAPFLVFLPSLPEQKRIVGILDEAFAGIDQAIANTEKNLQNARDLFESYLNNIFTQKGDGWVEKKLNETCEITAKLIDPKEDEFLDLPHIGAGNMLSQSDELVDIQTAREEGLISGKFVFEEGVVLYSKIRPYLMKVCRPDFTGLCSADVYPLMPIKGILERDFLFYMLLSKDFTDYAIKGSARAGMPKVNRTHLFDYATHIPSVETQCMLTAQIDKVYVASKQTETIYQQKLTALKELKQSLLQKAFAGELTAEMQEAA